jgi:nucleotide-binding universal stress UspA family protein
VITVHPAPTGPDPPSRAPRLLLATDLSTISGPATDEAFDTARRLGAQLLVVSVIDATSLRLPGGRFRARVDQVRERRQAAAQELVERGRREGVRVTFLVWEGEPGESILEAARAEEADLIVIGSHGRGPIGRLILGSVSQHVVQHAAVPVVVVRRDVDGVPPTRTNETSR